MSSPMASSTGNKVRLSAWIRANLEANRYPEELKWAKPDNATFQVKWVDGRKNKGSASNPVFKAWAMCKGKYKEETDRSVWKRNFRCALQKADDIEKIKGMNAGFMTFRLKNRTKSSVQIVQNNVETDYPQFKCTSDDLCDATMSTVICDDSSGYGGSPGLDDTAPGHELPLGRQALVTEPTLNTVNISAGINDNGETSDNPFEADISCGEPLAELGSELEEFFADLSKGDCYDEANITELNSISVLKHLDQPSYVENGSGAQDVENPEVYRCNDGNNGDPANTIEINEKGHSCDYFMHGMFVEVFYLGKLVLQKHVNNEYGCYIGSKHPRSSNIPLKIPDLEDIFGKNIDKQEIMILPKWDQDRSKAKASKALDCFLKGIRISCFQGKISIQRMCKTKIFTTNTPGLEELNIPRNTETCIYDLYKVWPQNQAENLPTPSLHTYIYLGEKASRVGVDNVHIQIKVTSCLGSALLKHNSVEHDVDVSRSTTIDYLVDCLYKSHITS